jgi:hypothetical protein
MSMTLSEMEKKINELSSEIDKIKNDTERLKTTLVGNGRIELSGKKLVIDSNETLTGILSAIKKCGVLTIPGSNGTLEIRSNDNGATVWIWKTADGGVTWSKQSQLY